MLQATTIDPQLSPFGHPLIHITAHLGQMLAADEGAHFVLLCLPQPRADPQFLHQRREACHQRIGGFIPYHHGYRDGHTALPGRPVGCPHQGGNCLLEVCIRHHHHVVLGAAQRLHPLAVGRSGRVDVLGDGGGADKRHGADSRVGQQHVHHLLVAVHHVDHAIRQAGLLEQLGHAQGEGRILLGRFEDKGVAAGNGHREHPQRHHGREVERGDAGAHPDRLHHGVAVHSAPHVEGVLPLEQMGNATGELHYLQTAGQLALSVGEDLAVLAADKLRQLVPVLLHQLLEAKQHPRPHQRRGLRPLGKGLLGHSDGLLALRRARQPHASLLLATGRIEDGPLAFAATILTYAVDKIADPVCHVSSVMGNGWVHPTCSRPRRSGAIGGIRAGPAGHPAAG